MKVTPETLTDEMVLSAMDPNGATMKYGAICTQIEIDTGLGCHDAYRAADRILQRMKRTGRVELIKGPGAGWRIVGLPRPRIGAINARARAEGSGG